MRRKGVILQQHNQAASFPLNKIVEDVVIPKINGGYYSCSNQLLLCLWNSEVLKRLGVLNDFAEISDREFHYPIS